MPYFSVGNGKFSGNAFRFWKIFYSSPVQSNSGRNPSKLVSLKTIFRR
jgi:hypothetical protein